MCKASSSRLHEGAVANDLMHGMILTWQSAVSLGCLQVENNLVDNRMTIDNGLCHCSNWKV